ncbi:MAG: TonB-dependent receptor plug domain-containing protein [Bacteroidia bacterium]|nr:TonB-dependent receptor plug domain-containing protein [Bacteroidia bacterium]
MRLAGKYTFYILILITCCGFAQNTDSLGKNILHPSVNEILSVKPDLNQEVKVTIANLIETNVYEAPSAITIITDEDIKQLGYRDLIDVLNTVPGINFATDIKNGVSIGMRGIWGEEGKILFMLNGLAMNDMAEGSIVLGNRFPLDNIQRIEVIRGAGSSIYGGLAALGVINIITKSANELNGHSINLNSGFSKNANSKNAINYNFGSTLLKGMDLTVTTMASNGQRSNDKRNLSDGTPVNFKDSSLTNNFFLAFGLKYKNLKVKQIYEDYNFQATYEPIFSLMRTLTSEISYNLKYKSVSFTPYYIGKVQLPWNKQYGAPEIYDEQNFRTSRRVLGLYGDVKLHKKLSLIYGGQVYRDNIRHFNRALKLENGNFVNAYNGFNFYSEMLFITKYANFSTGGRFDRFAYFEPNIVPRLCIAKSIKKWHYKILYGHSFKLPLLQNINLDTEKELVPEKVIDMQMETGYHGKAIDIGISLFDQKVNELIVFGYDTAFNESYKNSGNVRVMGFELMYKFRFRNFVLKSNYSNYGLTNSGVKEIQADTNDFRKGNISLPRHKSVTNLSYMINPRSTFNIFYIFQSKKYGYERTSPAAKEAEQVEYPETHNFNLVYQYNGLIKGLVDINVGIYNLLGTQNYYTYAYREGASPVFGMGRELLFNIRFKL